jgi:hypothetical protein
LTIPSITRRSNTRADQRKSRRSGFTMTASYSSST